MPEWIRKWNVTGSTGNIYVVSEDENGEFGCSCPVWTFKRKTCKHIIWLKDQLPGLKPDFVNTEFAAAKKAAKKAEKKEKAAVQKALEKLYNDPNILEWF